MGRNIVKKKRGGGNKELKKIQKEVLFYNIKLIKSGLVFLNFGNFSSRYADNFVIKPSGIDLKKVKADHMCLYNSKRNKYKPSVDSPMHHFIYKNFHKINSVTHTHSKFATAFAQASKKLDCIGTTQADYFRGSIPVISNPHKNKVINDYELNLGKKIVSYFKKNKINYLHIPGVLLEKHGVVAWGKNASQCFANALLIEYVAELNFYSLLLKKKIALLPSYILNKHFIRKHGKKKYYGQD
jgi:L-ribulose-5-phosphate 4-epimerase